MPDGGRDWDYMVGTKHFLNSLNRQELKRLISGGDYLKTWEFIEKEIFLL
jgi:hypothetical protein